MFSLIKQGFIVLLSFSSSLATQCLSLNDEPCMVRLTLIALSPVELKTCQCECRNYSTCKKDYNWNPSTCICENSKYLKSITDDSVIA